MSMLSSQVDELRELATRYYELQVGAVKAVKMPSNMGSILREAADTIWELCDDLQRAHRENAKLREYVTKLEQANIVLDSDNTDLLCDMKDMQFFIAENAKLRELARDMFGGYKGAVEMLPSSYSKNVAEMAVMDISDRMRELRVEVDG